MFGQSFALDSFSWSLGSVVNGATTLESANPQRLYVPAEIMAVELRKGGEAHKILDIAAGHGMFGIAAAKQNPTANIYAADWKNVLEVAMRNAQAAGVADRFHQLVGSAFEADFGGDYDLVLIANFLHHFDSSTCTLLCARCIPR
jgi:2-polyprenyl-3-methyl-5-hydroxy-6-metoxy-1,4-benzoquinol methylase